MTSGEKSAVDCIKLCEGRFSPAAVQVQSLSLVFSSLIIMHPLYRS